VIMICRIFVIASFCRLFRRDLVVISCCFVCDGH